MEQLPAAMVDVAFALGGRTLPREHRHALAEALGEALPWFAGDPRSGVHRLKLVPGTGAEAMVSPRSRLTLRVPRERADEAAALAGSTLDIAGHRVQLQAAQQRELLPHGTLYAWLVESADADEAAFLAILRSELEAMDVRVQPVCGRWQRTEALVGCSLMLSGLDRAQSLAVLQQGLGPHRALGCGLFVPHKSAAAVGAPD